MKTKILLLTFVIWGLATAVPADDSQASHDVQFRPLTGKESVEVKQKLESFDKGTATLDSLTDSQERTMKILEYYVMHTNEVTTKMKLPISRSFALWGQFTQAAYLAQEYVNVYSNDVRGWKVLGASRGMLKSYDEAVEALTNAARLGDEKNFVVLGLSALTINRLDILKNIVVPHLLVQMNDSEEFPERQRIQMRGCLIAYALKADKKEIFIKAVTGVDFSKISQWPELESQIALGCKGFEGSDIDKIRQELESAASSTNNISNPPH